MSASARYLHRQPGLPMMMLSIINEPSIVRKNRRLPNFRNLSIHLRLLVLHMILLLGLTAALSAMGLLVPNAAPMQAVGLAGLPTAWALLTELALVWVPPMLLILGGLYACYPWMRGWPYRWGVVVILSAVTVTTFLTMLAYQHWLSPQADWQGLSVCGLALLDASLCLYYLDLVQRAYSPAIAEARLQALQARIRPHFLFNSLNAVLSLIRSQPKHAETALEDMADLFRVLMAENNALVPLAQEIALCQQYLNIEQLRLGERLTCVWRMPVMLPQVNIPPLILQPLLENAVYHGIEPRPHGGTIEVDVLTTGNTLVIKLVNPLPAATEPATPSAHGNQMAIKNIRERLRLHYDFEAQLSLAMLHGDGADARYCVELRLPMEAS